MAKVLAEENPAATDLAKGDLKVIQSKSTKVSSNPFFFNWKLHSSVKVFEELKVFETDLMNVWKAVHDRVAVEGG